MRENKQSWENEKTVIQSVIGARRMRAGWEFISKEEPEKTEDIVTKS